MTGTAVRVDSHKNRSLPTRLRCAWMGLRHGVRAEHSLKFQLAAFALLVTFLIIVRAGPLWWALAMLASGGVFAAELFNTSIEELADHLHPEVHDRIRVVKDCAAAAVLVMVLGAIAVGVALVVSLLRRG
ncbi:MAG TPA: diacylglycerol kinase [Steroidobacteraceae bacterium]|nr:diacylglycerol kinase [Steroidobacteraceae bacterium]